MAEAARRHTTVGFGLPAGPFLTSVAQVAALPPLGARRRPPPPVPPSEPVGLAQRDTDPEVRAVVSKPADDVVAVPEAERVGGVSLQLDVAVERRRWLFWRLALSLVVRRLGR
jgi:hypothetical protein